jgi:hypothetical protein
MGNGLLAASRLSPSLDGLVRAFCMDFPRAVMLSAAQGSHFGEGAGIAFYRDAVYEGAAELCGDRMAEQMIREIAQGTGYAKSELYELSEVTYKHYKMLTKGNIARRLGLINIL